MAAPIYKPVIETEGITIHSFGNERPKCNFIGCNKNASFKFECGNSVKYSCNEHSEQIKLEMSADAQLDCSERVCTQDGPHDLNRTILDTPAY